MSRLIDADALKRRAQKVASEAWKMKVTARVETILNQFIDWIDDAATIELEITRCKDCKYNADTHKCLNPDSFFLVPNDDDFCSYAERREE